MGWGGWGEGRGSGQERLRTTRVEFGEEPAGCHAAGTAMCRQVRWTQEGLSLCCGQWCPPPTPLRPRARPRPRQVLAVTAFHQGRAGKEQGRSAGTGQWRPIGAGGGTRLDQERPALSRHWVSSPSVGRWRAGGELTPAVRGWGRTRESVQSAHPPWSSPTSRPPAVA